jgi:uncharacterized protein YjeT (DUF2065 family)
MAALATLAGLGIAGVGVALVIAPDWLLSLTDLRSGSMRWALALGRIGLGVIFVRAAPDTGAPLVFQVVGVLAVATGVIIAFLPAIWQPLVDSLLAQPPGFFRIIGVASTLFGLLLASLV